MAFTKGVSGNPRGRPRRDRAGPDALRRNLLAQAPEILAKLVEQAKEGDPGAAKMVLDRCLPSLRPVDQVVPVALGEDLAQAGCAVLAAVGSGAATPSEAGSLAGVLASLARVQETVDLAARVTALEECTHAEAKP